MTRSLTLVPLLLGACIDDNNTGYSGYKMADHFPMDGKRSWEYMNEAHNFKLDVEMSTSAEASGDGDEIRAFDTFHDPSGDLLMTVRWSSGSVNGVRIWGFEVYDVGGGGEDSGQDSGGDSGEATLEYPEWTPGAYTFDPPILLADREEKPGDEQVTETGGFTFTSTFAAVEECENLWVGGENTWTCLRVDLTEASGADLRILGSYWMAPRYGLSWFELQGDTAKWILTRAEWESAD